MAARRAVQAAKRQGDAGATAAARRRVHAAKVALGERGPPWWGADGPRFDRRLAKNTPYSAWARQVTSA